MNENIEILNEYMANLKVFNNNLYNMHFNVEGSSFLSIHKKLEEYYNKIASFYDSIGERIKMLGGYPTMNLLKIEEISSIKSMKSMSYTGLQVMEVLDNDISFLKDYTIDLINYYTKQNDYYTLNILNNNLNFFEKESWIIKESLK